MTVVSTGSVVHSVSALPTDTALEPSTGGARLPDEESREWLRDLRSDGPEREAAMQRLHALLLRAARFEVARRRPALPHLRGEEFGEIALEAADDALMSVLARLDDFRGASRFTTWAYKFALYEAATKVRKRSWQGREISLTTEAWPLISDDRQPTAQQSVETAERLAALHEAIEDELSPHQREVVVALALNEVPVDVLAERLNTTRGALYKTLHDGRQKLRGALAARGLGLEEHKEQTRA